MRKLLITLVILLWASSAGAFTAPEWWQIEQSWNLGSGTANYILTTAARLNAVETTASAALSPSVFYISSGSFNFGSGSVATDVAIAEILDRGNNVSGGILTAPTTGYYWVSCNLKTPNGTTNGTLNLYGSLNGADVIKETRSCTPYTDFFGVYGIGTSNVIYMTSGSTFKFYVKHAITSGMVGSGTVCFRQLE